MLTDLLDYDLEHVIGLLRYELPDAPIDAETPTAYAELICRILFELRGVPELCRRRDKWRGSYSAVCIYGDLAVYQSPERPLNNKMCSVQCQSEREAWQFVAERSPNRIDGQLSAVWVIGLDKAGRLELTPDIYAGIIQNARIIREQWATR